MGGSPGTWRVSPTRLGPARKPLGGVKGRDGALEEGNEVLGWAIPGGMQCPGIVLLHHCPPMGGFPPPTFRAVCFSPPITEPSLEHGVWGTRANHIGAHRELATVLFST